MCHKEWVIPCTPATLTTSAVCLTSPHTAPLSNLHSQCCCIFHTTLGCGEQFQREQAQQAKKDPWSCKVRMWLSNLTCQPAGCRS